MASMCLYFGLAVCTMADTQEDKARLASIFEAIRRLSEEAGLYDDEPTPEEIVETVKQVRKEMAEERAKDERHN